MDQARWLVVISVLFFMFTTLTLLSRYNQQPVQDIKINVTEAEVGQKINNSVSTLVRSKGRRFNKGEISYSKPPKHVFAIDSEADIELVEKNMRNAGKIVE